MSSPSPSPETPRRRHKQSPSRGLLWTGAALAAGGVIVLFGAQAWLESYLKGEVFRKKTETAIGRAIHAECTLSELQRQGNAITTESLLLTGQNGAFFKSAQLRDLRAEMDLGAVWRRVWKVETLRFQRLELNLDTPDAAPETATAEVPAFPQPASAPWWAGFLPRQTEIGSIHTDRATLTRAGATLRDARMDAKPLDGGGWEIVLETGELKSPGMPAMELSQSRLVAHAGKDLTGKARLLVKSGGQMTLNGGWTNTSGADVHAQLENLDVQPFLPAWWKTRLRGGLQGQVRFVQPVTAKTGELSGDLKLTNATLEALPLLAQLDTFLHNSRFSQVPLKNASVRFSQTPERTELRDLDLDAGGIMRITGNVTVKSGTLQGNLMLGISSSLIQWLPQISSKVFGESREGYVWAPFEISGPPEQPVENLSPRLAAAALESARDIVRDLPNKVPQALPEAAKGVLDAVKSLIPPK
jgi:hypothetical protein